MTIRVVASAEPGILLPSVLFPAASAQPISFFSAGSEIYGQGEQAGHLYRVEFGAVRVYRLLADGRRQISAFYLPGEVFGFEADGVHRFFAEAICATGLKTMRVSSETAFSQELLSLALANLVRAQGHLLVLGRQNAAERVAAFLLDMTERQGGLSELQLPMSRADIGDYLGLTIETVSRVLSKMKVKGSIRLPSLRTVEIADLRALRALTD